MFLKTQLPHFTFLSPFAQLFHCTALLSVGVYRRVLSHTQHDRRTDGYSPGRWDMRSVRSAPTVILFLSGMISPWKRTNMCDTD